MIAFKAFYANYAKKASIEHFAPIKCQKKLMYSVLCRKICEQMLVQGKFKKLGFAKFLKNVKFMKIAKMLEFALQIITSSLPTF